MSDATILVGAVTSAPDALTTWEGIREHFRREGVPMDVVPFTDYERQVEALLEGHLDVAWNTPLAHVRVQRRTNGTSVSLGMRDSDRDFRSRVLVRRDAEIRSILELGGKTLAVGSRDSTQARILPIHFLRKEGSNFSKVQMLAFDTDLGTHGDTGTSEIEVVKALYDGRADAGIVGDSIWSSELAAGGDDPRKLDVLWTTPPFDLCMFDAPPSAPREKLDPFQKTLMSMRWENPEHRRVMKPLGVKQWMPPREEGYRVLQEALAFREGRKKASFDGGLRGNAGFRRVE